MKQWLRQPPGMTLIELVVVMAVTAMLLLFLPGLTVFLARIPLKEQSAITASHQIRKVALLATEDASAAQSFTAGTEPDYGTFKWFEFSGSAPIPVSVRYTWQNGQVLREHERNGAVTSPQVVMEGVAQYGDVQFQYTAPQWTYDQVTKSWSYAEGKVEVSVKTTHDAGPDFPLTVFTANLAAGLRPQLDLPAPLPARLPPPLPPPNQVAFRVSGNPTIVTGTLRSGTGKDLRYDDANYYVVRAAGTPRTVSWEATSEAIDYTTISDIKIEFTGRVDIAGVSQSFFVYTGAYGTSPDQASVYTSANTDQKVFFNLDADQVAYVNSLGTKVIKVKLVASTSSFFDLSADQLIFKVAGTPSPTFSRDFAADTDPSLEAGSYVGGNFVSLSEDDTNYYITQEVSSVIQWSVVSEPISLDTLSSVQVIFIGRATRGAPVQQIYVYNPAKGGDGFGTSPSLQTTYSSTNTDTNVSFFLSAADLDYVKSLVPKEIRIRVKGTDSTTNWRLEADQVIFRVKP